MLKKITLILISIWSVTAHGLTLQELISQRSAINGSLENILNQLRSSNIVPEEGSNFCYRLEREHPTYDPYFFHQLLLRDMLSDFEASLLGAQARLNEAVDNYTAIDQRLSKLNENIKAAKAIVDEFQADPENYGLAVKVTLEIPTTYPSNLKAWKDLLEARIKETDIWVKKVERKILQLIDLETSATQLMGPMVSARKALEYAIADPKNLPAYREALNPVEQQVAFYRSRLQEQLSSPVTSQVVLSEPLLVQARMVNAVFDPNSPWSLWEEVLVGRLRQLGTASQQVKASLTQGMALKSVPGC